MLAPDQVCTFLGELTKSSSDESRAALERTDLPVVLPPGLGAQMMVSSSRPGGGGSRMWMNVAGGTKLESS